ncbi:MAG TPA: 2-oxo acid dehydrogenase subunit E2 [Jatrophihabitans sp.]|nr:2-oxo acid dehydrogenase subunit E2 [Jatrophihabitans sp.]
MNWRSGRRLTGWRKLAAASWRAPGDPQFFGSLEIDAAALQSYVDYAREHSDCRLTITHLIGRAVAHGLVAAPGLTNRLAHGREYPRQTLDLFFIVTTGDGTELTGVKIDQVDGKSAVELGAELSARTAELAAGTDTQLGRTKRLLAVLPPRLLRPAIRLSAWLTSDLNLDLPKLGLPRQAFGAAMVSSVGMWQVSTAYSPLAHYYRVPVLVLVNSVEPRVVARSGRPVVRPMLTLTATFDHRYTDGFQAARFAAAVAEYCADPRRFEPALTAAAGTDLAAAGGGVSPSA